MSHYLTHLGNVLENCEPVSNCDNHKNVLIGVYSVSEQKEFMMFNSKYAIEVPAMEVLFDSCTPTNYSKQVRNTSNIHYIGLKIPQKLGQ